MATKNKLKKTIVLFTRFIKEKKVSDTDGWYTKRIEACKKILYLIKLGKFSPREFNTLDSQMKWDIADSKLLKNITWHCDKCGAYQGKTPPRAGIFHGDSTHCSECDRMLTCRTGGGQNNPFNMTFKKIKPKPVQKPAMRSVAAELAISDMYRSGAQYGNKSKVVK